MSQSVRLDSSLYALVRAENIDGFNRFKPVQRCVSFGGADLRGLDLRDMDVANIDFTNAFFGCADLRGLDMRSCGMEGARLEYALVAGTRFPEDITPDQIYASVTEGQPLRHRQCLQASVA